MSFKFSWLWVLAIVAYSSGCGSSGTSSNNFGAVFPGGCVGTGCNSLGTFTTGDTETLTPASMYALSEYAGMTITNATNVQVNINLAEIQTSPAVFLGQMVIQYNDQNGGQHVGTFVNGTSTQGYRNYPNTISTLVGNSYRIFFEDSVGAIVLVIASPAGTDTVTTSSGQIWFYNFNSAAPNPLYSGQYDPSGNYYPPGYVFCWMIDFGPYDCRNFGVPPSTPYYDTGGKNTVPAFSLLGNISSINLHNALGI